MPPSLDTAAHQAGVTNVVPDPSDTELYVAQAAHATLWDGATEKVELITFASKDAEDNWIKIAKQFGAVVLNQGDGWVVAK